jgi:hypothetical protein
MRLYRGEVTSFWRHHPGEKAKLAAQATWMLWSPAAARSEGGPDEGGAVDVARKVVEPLYMVPLYLLAIAGLFVVATPFRVLALSFLGYETLAAWVFAGTTRYRVPWDFVLALLAAAVLARLPFPPFRPSSQKR